MVAESYGLPSLPLRLRINSVLLASNRAMLDLILQINDLDVPRLYYGARLPEGCSGRAAPVHPADVDLCLVLG